MRAFGLTEIGITAALTAAGPAQAQTTIDISKITCEQWLAFKVADPDHIALWLSGYFNGRRDNTVVEIQSFKKNIESVRELCIRSPNMLIMKAVESKIQGKK